MKLKLNQRVPVFIAAVVIVLACLVQWRGLGPVERLEYRTYDWRVRLAQKFPAPVATNLGLVAIGNDTIARVNNGLLGQTYGLYWPRHIYGLALRELSAQGAGAVGFDILLAEQRSDHELVPFAAATVPGLKEFAESQHPDPRDPKAPVQAEGGLKVLPDDFFAWQLGQGVPAIIAASEGVLPHEKFRRRAAIADISAEPDADGVLRRARAFHDYRFWHPIFRQVERDYGVDLDHAKIESNQITMVTPEGQEVKVPLGADGMFDPKDFDPAARQPRAAPFEDRPVWHMGIALAAHALGADLTLTRYDLHVGKVSLLSSNGVVLREIPVDHNGFFYVNWELPLKDPRLTEIPFEELLLADLGRERCETNAPAHDCRGKLLIVGSLATGNDLTDMGATPLSKATCLVSKHWNVANSIITGRFVTRSSLGVDFIILIVLGVLTAVFTWSFRALPALGAVAALGVGYVLVAVMCYNQHRLWLPIILPVAGVLLMQHVCLVTWRVVFEQAEKRRVRSVFSKVVAPEVVHELLDRSDLQLGGARREITVFFADVRGFTAFTDVNREEATALIRKHKLEGEQAERVYDEQAREALNTVNTYLALVADTIKHHHGTLDKYIGDCVMAFWGAPGNQPQHALHCVRAAVDAQRAIDELNRKRADENTRRELQNFQRASEGQTLLPALPILSLGTGINTGAALVGLMGSDKHGLNYTVFGREVNVASRLESLSGRGRILIGELTFLALQRDDPQLAATCTALAPVNVKGIRETIKVYEVPWRLPGTVSPIGDDYGSASSGGDTSATGFVRMG